MHILGWQAQGGDQITLYHGTGLTTYTYDGLGWSPQEPVLAIGEVFIYTGPSRNYDRSFVVWP